MFCETCFVIFRGWGFDGAFHLVTANHSIAVDSAAIPPHIHVKIDAVGDRYADDSESQVISYHIDNFLGAGNAVVQVWENGPVNRTHRKVKFLGGN